MVEENGLQVFENESFGNVRVVMRDDEPWFVAADLCRGLSIDSTQTRRLDDDEKGVCKIQTLGGEQEMLIVNESGMYALILGSRKREARKFKRWITHDVIPKIRKTGSYALQTKQDSYMIEDPIARAKRWIEEREERDVLETENKLLLGEQLKWADRNFINAAVRAYAGGACGSEFGIAWTNYKKELLYKHGINLNSRRTKYLNETGKKTPPKITSLIDDSEMSNAVATIVALCRESKVDISELINNIR